MKFFIAIRVWRKISRCLVSFLFYFRRDPSNWSIGVELIFLAELTFLMLLSIVTSNDHFTIHRNSFVAFLSCAILHMVVRLHHSRRLLLRNYTTLKLFKRKVITACVFYVAIILAGKFITFYQIQSVQYFFISLRNLLYSYIVCTFLNIQSP